MTSSMGASFDDDSYLPPEEPAPEFGPEPPESFDAPGGNYQRNNYGGGRRKYGKRDELENPQRYGEFRQPPSDKDAEQGVLGAMLLSPSSVIEVIDEVDPEDFYYPAHQLIYSAMLDLYSDGTDIDPVIVSSRLDRQQNLERIGGAVYLHTLLATVPTAANARYYAEIVAEKALLRKLVDSRHTRGPAGL